MAEKIYRHLPRFGRFGVAFVLLICLPLGSAWAQEKSGYFLGEDHGVEMMVNILGEVHNPGEYRVPDRTNLLELLSKAGGPTQFSRLKSVSVRRMPAGELLANRPESTTSRAEILRVNVQDMLQREDSQRPPVLQPGDIVFVPKKSWQWKDISGLIRDVSVVVSAYYFYVRATQ